MSRRLNELAARQTALQLRCAAQRDAVAREMRGIEMRLQLANRATALARAVLLNPAVLVAGAAGLVALSRAGGFRLLTRGLLLAAAARRLLQLLKKL